MRSAESATNAKVNADQSLFKKARLGDGVPKKPDQSLPHPFNLLAPLVGDGNAIPLEHRGEFNRLARSSSTWMPFFTITTLWHSAPHAPEGVGS